MGRTHVGEPPAVVGVEQDQFHLDVQRSQLPQARFNMSEERRIEAAQVKSLLNRLDAVCEQLPREAIRAQFALTDQGVGVQRWFNSVVEIVLWEDEEAHLVERTVGKGCQRAELELLVAVQPVVDGGSQWKIRSAIRISKVVLALDRDGTVIVRAG